MTTEELRGELARAITMTADALSYLAACWVELERRGEDLTDLRIGLAPYLREVAAGRLAPEAVISFAGEKMKLAWIAGQPPNIQRRLADGGIVTLRTSDGGERSARFADLTAFEVRQITNVEATMQAAPAAPAARQKTSRRAPAYRTLSVRLTQDEYARLADEADRLKMPVHQLARQKLTS